MKDTEKLTLGEYLYYIDEMYSKGNEIYLAPIVWVLFICFIVYGESIKTIICTIIAAVVSICLNRYINNHFFDKRHDEIISRVKASKYSKLRYILAYYLFVFVFLMYGPIVLVLFLLFY